MEKTEGNKVPRDPSKVPLNPLVVRALDQVPLEPVLLSALETVRKQNTTKPPPVSTVPSDHYVEYMSLKGWLDLDLNDPDLAVLFD